MRISERRKNENVSKDCGRVEVRVRAIFRLRASQGLTGPLCILYKNMLDFWAVCHVEKAVDTVGNMV